MTTRRFNQASIVNVFLFLGVISALAGFIIDLRNTVAYGGIDFRDRVVGARLIKENKDPYFFKWREGMPDTILQPFENPSNLYTRATFPPTVLLLNLPLSNFSYFSQKVIWFVGQWILLLAAIWLAASCAKTSVKRKIIWVIGLLFVSNSYFWRLHVERGQIYIVYSFLFALSYWINVQSFALSKFASGLVLGILGAFRPPALVMLIPLIIAKKWKIAAGCLIGFVSAVGLTLTRIDLGIWRSYLYSMKLHSQTYMRFLSTRDDFVTWNTPVIEGLSTLSKAASIPSPDTSLHRLMWHYERWIVPMHVHYIILLAVVLLLAAFMIRWYHQFSPGSLFLIGAALMTWVEFFLPAPRSSYNNVQWILPLALVAINYNWTRWQHNAPLIFFLILVFFNFTWSSEIGAAFFRFEMLVNIFITVFAVLYMKEKSTLFNGGKPAS